MKRIFNLYTKLKKNNLAYKLNFNKIGHDVQIWPLTKIVSPEHIKIGNSVIIDDYTFINGGKTTTLGDFIHIASFVSITGGGTFIMEDFTNIATGCRILTGTDNFKGDFLIGPSVPLKYRDVFRSFVTIKKHVTIGANTVILPGVTIGEGTVIGANSLVTTNLEPWSIYVGSPVKKIKSRPYEKILDLEKQLKNELYDLNGIYIPKK